MFFNLNWQQLFESDPLWQWWGGFSLLLISGILLWRIAVWWQCQQAVFSFSKPAKSNLLFKALKKIGLVFYQHASPTKLNVELALFLRTLGSTLKAGYSVPQALEFTIEEIKGPLKFKLAAGLNLLKIRQPLEKVLKEWERALPAPEFKFLLNSLALQARQGGDLVKLCYGMAFLLEEREKLERDVKSFTAQGKMSGLLMAFLWPLSLILFAWLAPSHTNVLFHTAVGKTLLALSLVLELIGFWLIWRLVRITL